MKDVHDVFRLCIDSDHLLVDIRGPSAWCEGIPRGAKTFSKEQLERQAEVLLNQFKTVFIICYKGQLSQQLCQHLTDKYGTQLGNRFESVIGGFAAWQQQGLIIETPDIDLQATRYERQTKLAGFGEQAQIKLKQSHVLVVGAGGLGSPALMYLAGAGVGTMTLVDDDVVALHNLHRQILYSESDVGLKKADAAKSRLSKMNSQIDIKVEDQRLTAANADQLLEGVDLVLDGSDNVATRYVINDACKRLNKPWLFAAVSGFTIQFALFSGNQNEICYRCLFPELIDAAVGNCSEEGILGSVPGMAAMMQSTEAIKYITGLGTKLNRQMLIYDVFNHQFKVLKYPANKTCNH